MHVRPVPDNIADFGCQSRLLRTGAKVYLRPITPKDQEKLSVFLKELDSESVFFRFHQAKADFPQAIVEELCSPNQDTTVALIASPSSAFSEIIGEARYSVDPNCRDSITAEVALVLKPEYQDLGLGTILIEELAFLAHSQKIELFKAEVLGSNRKMFALLSGLGFPLTKTIKGGNHTILMPLETTPEFIALRQHRKRNARKNYWLRLILAPFRANRRHPR